MALPNAYSQYNNNKILTASPTELTLMLYEGAIKFCNIAEAAIENAKSEVLALVEVKVPAGIDTGNRSVPLILFGA